MKKHFILFFLACICCIFVSCGTKNTPSKTSGGISAMMGKWVETTVDYNQMLNTVNDFIYEYSELSSEYDIYLRQAIFEKANQVRDKMDKLIKSYNDYWLDNCVVVEINDGIVKIGEGTILLNPTSKNLWIRTSAYSGSNMNLTVGIQVDEWQKYRYSVKEGELLYFDNGRECLFIADKKLCWEGVTDFVKDNTFFSKVK